MFMRTLGIALFLSILSYLSGCGPQGVKDNTPSAQQTPSSVEPQALQQEDATAISMPATPTTPAESKPRYLAPPKFTEQDAFWVNIQDEIQNPQTLDFKEPDNHADLDLDRLTDNLSIASKTRQYRDIWDRLRQGFQLTENYDHPRVKKYHHFFLKNPASVKAAIERAKPFLYFIVDEAEKRNMPLEIALLPIVESNFYPYAQSHMGAVGTWQFTETTGQLYGLSQNWWYDGRIDVYASTLAALDYLNYLYGLNQQDWLKAIASYNSGYGFVLKAERLNKSRGKPLDYWSLQLPKETTEYLPRLLAISSLIGASPNNGIDFPSIANKPQIDVVELEAQADLRLVAQWLDLSQDEFYQLNPGYKRLATPPQGPYHVVVPYHKAYELKQKLRRDQSIYQVQWTRHKVVNGDSLGKLAQKYATTIAAIRSINQIKGNNIYIGDVLMIPQTNARYAKTSIAKQDQATPPRVVGPDTEPEKVFIYQVRAGDNLRTIADRYGVAIDQIVRWNDIDIHKPIFVGQNLKIKSPKPIEKLLHTVKPNESFWTISKTYDVEIADIRRWNKMSPKERIIHPGDQLVLWVKKDALDYKVKNGDTLWDIAKAHKTSVQELASTNQLKQGQFLIPGQTLKIPIARSND